VSERRTRLLVLLLVIAGVCAWISWSRLERLRESARMAETDLEVCCGYLRDLSSAGSATTLTGAVDASELNRRLRDAATAAGISDRLVSVEPSQPQRIENSDYRELPVFLRLESVNLRQLVAFLQQLGGSEAGCRTKLVTLDPAPGDQSPEQWSADVTLGYLLYSPGQGGT
jgi:hypothetical protein